MILKQTIEQVVAEQIQDTPIFLVEIKISPSNEIEVVIDSDERLGIDDCIKLSKAIEFSLDREADDFELSVYSAGIGEPLKIYRQYLKTVGRPVEILLLSGIKQIGVLTAVDEQGVTIEFQTKEVIDGKKRKELVTKTEKYNFDQIKTTKEELDIR